MIRHSVGAISFTREIEAVRGQQEGEIWTLNSNLKRDPSLIHPAGALEYLS